MSTADEVMQTELKIFENIFRIVHELLKNRKPKQRNGKTNEEKERMYGEHDIEELLDANVDLVAIQESLSAEELADWKELADKMGVLYATVENPMNPNEKIIMVQRSDLESAEICFNKIFTHRAIQEAGENPDISNDDLFQATELFTAEENHALNEKGVSFMDALDHMTDREYARDKDFYLFDRENPDHYLKMRSEKATDHTGKEYTKTTYEEYFKSELIGTYDDGRFPGRDKLFWSKLKSDIKGEKSASKDGKEVKVPSFSDNLVVLNSKEDFERFRDTYNKQLEIINEFIGDIDYGKAEKLISELKENYIINNAISESGNLNFIADFEQNLDEIKDLQENMNSLKQERYELFNELQDKLAADGTTIEDVVFLKGENANEKQDVAHTNVSKEEFRDSIDRLNNLKTSINNMEIAIREKIVTKDNMLRGIEKSVCKTLENDMFNQFNNGYKDQKLDIQTKKITKGMFISTSDKNASALKNMCDIYDIKYTSADNPKKEGQIMYFDAVDRNRIIEIRNGVAENNYFQRINEELKLPEDISINAVINQYADEFVNRLNDAAYMSIDMESSNSHAFINTTSNRNCLQNKEVYLTDIDNPDNYIKIDNILGGDGRITNNYTVHANNIDYKTQSAMQAKKTFDPDGTKKCIAITDKNVRERFANISKTNFVGNKKSVDIKEMIKMAMKDKQRHKQHERKREAQERER